MSPGDQPAYLMASMRPSDITDGNAGTRFSLASGIGGRFNEAVGYYRRKPVPVVRRDGAVGYHRRSDYIGFNEAVGYYRRKRTVPKSTPYSRLPAAMREVGCGPA